MKNETIKTATNILSWANGVNRFTIPDIIKEKLVTDRKHAYTTIAYLKKHDTIKTIRNGGGRRSAIYEATKKTLIKRTRRSATPNPDVTTESKITNVSVTLDIGRKTVVIDGPNMLLELSNVKFNFKNDV